MTYAFHTPDKLCFILDLMNGGDLHYHLSQHGVFSEDEMKFYAAEKIWSLSGAVKRSNDLIVGQHSQTNLYIYTLAEGIKILPQNV